MAMATVQTIRENSHISFLRHLVDIVSLRNIAEGPANAESSYTVEEDATISSLVCPAAVLSSLSYFSSSNQEDLGSGSGDQASDVKRRSSSGKNICEHGRLKRLCKDCGGSSICEHGRRRIQCKYCGGSSVCAHGRRKYDCRDCAINTICEHGCVKLLCKDCVGASAFCEHGRRKNRCKECGRGAFL
jgi:hypothetical protein